MPADQPSKSSREKPFAVAVLRIGSHPLIYSIMVILAAGATVFFLAIVPLVRMLQSGGAASLADAQDRNRVAQNTLDAEKKLADAAAALSSADRDMLAYALPASVDAPSLAVIVKSLAVASGVKLMSFDVSEPPSEAGASAPAVGKAEITMSLELATYDRLKIFLTNMESSLRLFDLKSLSFSPGTGSLSIGVESYYLNNI